MIFGTIKNDCDLFRGLIILTLYNEEKILFDISVIVCCYNPDIDKLKKTLLSINNQIGVTVQIVISDDGSSIIYRNLIENWCHNQDITNIIYNFLPNNIGTVRNILSAIKFCESDYVKTISPGDYLFDKFSLCKYVEALKNDNVAISYGRAVYYTPEGFLLNYSNPINNKLFTNKKYSKYAVLYNDHILGATIACKKKFLYRVLSQIQGKSLLVEDQILVAIAILDGYDVIPINDYVIWYEYGLGVSTCGVNLQIIKDEYAITRYIEENYNSVLSKKIVKNRNLIMITNKIKKIIYKILFSFSYFIYSLLNKFKRNKLPKKITIKMLYEITSII